MKLTADAVIHVGHWKQYLELENGVFRLRRLEADLGEKVDPQDVPAGGFLGACLLATKHGMNCCLLGPGSTFRPFQEIGVTLRPRRTCTVTHHVPSMSYSSKRTRTRFSLQDFLPCKLSQVSRLTQELIESILSRSNGAMARLSLPSYRRP